MQKSNYSQTLLLAVGFGNFLNFILHTVCCEKS